MQNDSELIGKTFAGRYQMLERLGGGGTGDVYKALCTGTDSYVGVKVFSRLGSNPAGSLSRFEQEARAAAELSHPNIVALHEIGFSPEGHPFVVMEYFAGQSLAELISSRGALEPSDVVAVFSQVCAGLAHAHAHRIIHRDIKPSNIMVSSHGSGFTVKLIDFGGSQPLGSSFENQNDDLVGSPFYMSPEQCQGAPLDPSSDIFSVGCSMFEALTGRPPFIGDSVMSTIYKRVKEGAPPLSSVSAGRTFSPAIEKIVARALSPAPLKRYQNAADLLNDLTVFQQELERSKVGRLPGKERPLLIAAGIAVLVLAVPLVILFSGKAPGSQPVSAGPDLPQTADVVALAESGETALSKGDLELARKCYVLALKGLLNQPAPDHQRVAHCNIRLARIAMEQHDLPLAKSYAQNVVAINPVGATELAMPQREELADAHYQLGSVNRLQGQSAAAVASFRKALAVAGSAVWHNRQACKIQLDSVLKKADRTETVKAGGTPTPPSQDERRHR